jgi:hypothetical protein
MSREKCKYRFVCNYLGQTPLPIQPPAKVFECTQVLMHRITRKPTLLHMRTDVIKNRSKAGGSQPPTNMDPVENVVQHECLPFNPKSLEKHSVLC